MVAGGGAKTPGRTLTSMTGRAQAVSAPPAMPATVTAPAAAFQRERLWAAVYVSGASTRLVAVPIDGHHVGHPVTIDSWPIPSSRICAPHPPDCTEGQTFIGDYI